MVMTHKSVVAQKKRKIYIKEDDPSRKFMSKEDAVKKNEQLRANQEKVEQYAEKLKAEQRESSPKPVVEESITDQFEASDKAEGKDFNSLEIKNLELKLENEKGPGSKARKAKIQAKIDELKAV